MASVESKDFIIVFIGTIDMELFGEKETLKSYEIRHFVSLYMGDNLSFLRMQKPNFGWNI